MPRLPLSSKAQRPSAWLLPPLSVALSVSAAHAQAPQERVYLKYHGHISDLPADTEQVSCTFRFVAQEDPSRILYTESDSLLSITSQGRFATTLGDSANGFPPTLFEQRPSLHVECDTTGDGSPDVSVTEPVGQVPQSVRALSAARADEVVGPVSGPVNATSLSLAGEPLVSEQGEWLGAPISPSYNGEPLVQEGRWVGEVSSESVSGESVSATSLEVTGHSSSDTLSASSATLSSLYLTQLYHLDPNAPEGAEAPTLIDALGAWRGAINSEVAQVSALSAGSVSLASLTLADGSALINSAGEWLGPVRAYDSDADGVSDVQELALNTDPTDPASLPLDEDGDGVFDVFQSTNNTQNEASLADGLFIDRFELTQRSDVQSTSNGTPAWAASVLEFNTTGAQITALSVSFNATYTDATTGEPIAPTDVVVRLVHPASATFLTLHNSEELFQGLYNAATPPAAGWQVQGLTLDGLWQLVIEQSDPTRGVLTVTRFEMSASYQTPNLASATQDISLQGQYRLTGLSAPTEESEAVSSAHLEARLSAAADQVNLHTTQTITQTEEALRADLDVTYPSRPAYRSRLFETYDEALGAYALGDNASLFGGVAPSTWASQQVTADQLTQSNLDVLLNHHALTGANALLAHTHVSYPDVNINAQQAMFLIAHFEVENTTAAPIEWRPTWLTSCNVTANQLASASLNGALVWPNADDLFALNCSAPVTVTLTLTLPPQQVSDLVLVSSQGPANANGLHSLSAAITNDGLTLPEGLRFRASWAR